MRLLSLLFFFFSCTCSFGQSEIDSLQLVIKNSKTSEELTDTYAYLTHYYFDTDLSKAQSTIANLRLDIKKYPNCLRCIGISQYLEGMAVSYAGDYELSVKYLDSASVQFEKAKDEIYYRKSVLESSSIMMDLNRTKESKQRLENLIERIQNSANSELLPLAYFRLGDAYSYLNEQSNAIVRYLQTDSLLSLATYNDPSLRAGVHYNLAQIFRVNEDYEKAIDYLLKGEQYGAMAKDSFSLMLLRSNRGILYAEKNEPAKSIPILKNTLPYFKRVDRYQTGAILLFLGVSYQKEGNMSASTNSLSEALPYFKADSATLAKIHTHIASNYIATNDLNRASQALDQSDEVLTNLKDTQQQLEQYFTKVAYQKKRGNYKEALEMLQKHDSLKAELEASEKKEVTQELEAKYQTEKKEQEIALLTSQNELSEAQKRSQRNLLLGGLLLTTLAGLFFFFQYRNRQKTNKKLRELDTAKSTFFANISHEFRTPLTLIKGPLEDQLELETLTASKRKNLLSAHKNTQRLESLVDQLLALSKLESGNLQLQVQSGHLPPFLKAQAEAFTFSSIDPQITYDVSIESYEAIDWFDREAWQKIITNLLGNAFKYTPEKGFITVRGVRENKYYELSVSNSGSFISETQQKDIFTRFYQTHTQNPGTGIGLALVKELVELHKGTISVESSKEEGTTFHIRIPVARDQFLSHEILSETLQKPTEIDTGNIEVDIDSPIITSEDAPVLLVVDDTKEIRDYVHSLFESTHHIHTATNGEEGLELALEIIPDVIISDLMMPKLDGIGFTERIKTNELTSHIPVLLLTAKTGDENRLQGMQIGADAYLTKPFSPKILLATVENILENRRKLQDRFSQEVVLLPKEIAITSADEQFLERLQTVMDEHLTNPDFSANSFSDAMGVSRMQLHRKLKALSGQSTSEFLRTQRLKAAALLIKKEKITIAEVGYTVGFNDPSYFTKCFKKEFGVSPTEYAKKQ